MKRDRNVTVKLNGLGGLTMILQIVFLVLKLTELISWSWFWVLSPIIFSVGLSTMVFLIVGFVFYNSFKKWR